ncbi:hypothetical protein [Serratia proteamaculans]|uniref:Uncharacterized protein n=1 Tax=Serratia proteamaculans TaxID=28151 RepID=A0A5Q2VB80_SERPR|nr:hypothetical protein [Serratia proteamaculans]QGH61390.1 hypothetical protein GHV41_11340 [Serratia proteamaculans]
MNTVADYADLRHYQGDDTALMLTNTYHHGIFIRKDNGLGFPLKDDSALFIKDAKGRFWARLINDGAYCIDWWFSAGDESDYAKTITRACNALQVDEKEWGKELVPTTPAGITLVGPGGVRVCKTTARLKLWKNAIDFRGTLLDYRGADDNTECVHVEYSYGAPAIYNLRMAGDNDEKKNLSAICVYSTAKNLFGKPVAQLLCQNIWISNFHKGIMFGNNAYIQSWHSVMVHACHYPIYSETSNNAGEKIVFYKCLFSDGQQFYQGVHELYFRNCSFDYSGFGSPAEQLAHTDNGLFTLTRGSLDFLDCHFEWGNHSARNARPVFCSDGGGIVKIRRCKWHSVETNVFDKDDPKKTPYQLVDYFFFDRSTDLTGRCYIDGLELINADLKKGWSNAHIDMKNIGAPGHINMYRFLYLGDGTNHLPEPSWAEKATLQLNHVYARLGKRIASAAELSVSADKGVITLSTQTAATADKMLELYFPLGQNELPLWKMTFADLSGMTSLKLSVNTLVGQYRLDEAVPRMIAEKAGQWARQGELTAAAPLTLLVDRITALNDKEFIPLPAAYVNYARIVINLKDFAGTPTTPAHLQLTQCLCQKVHILSRTPNKAW